MQYLLLHAVDTLAISLFIYLLATFRDHRRRRGLAYPPGPPAWPIIGNFFDIPKDRPWIAYTDMSKKYGGRNILVTTGPPQLNPVSRRYHLPSRLLQGYYRAVFVFSH